MNTAIKLITTITTALLFSISVEAQQLDESPLSNNSVFTNFKEGIILARKGFAENDQYVLTDALYCFSFLHIVDTLYLKPQKEGSVRVFSEENISKAFEEEKDPAAIAQEAVIDKGNGNDTLSVTYETFQPHEKITYSDVQCEGLSMAIIVASANGNKIKVTVLDSNGKAQELFEKDDMVEGRFISDDGEPQKYMIIIENLSDEEDVIVIAIQ